MLDHIPNVYLVTDRLPRLLQSEHCEETSLWKEQSATHTDDWNAGKFSFSSSGLIGEVATDSEKASGLWDCHSRTRSLTPSARRSISVEGK